MAAVEERSHGSSEVPGAAVPERLARREQSRREDAERRREARDTHRPEQENPDYFTAEFNRERAAVQALLSACPGADRAAAAETLQRASERAARLQKFVNDSVMFLSQYELRQAQDRLQQLQAALDEARDRALPKKKFAFRARTKAKPAAPQEPPLQEPPLQEPPLQEPPPQEPPPQEPPEAPQEPSPQEPPEAPQEPPADPVRPGGGAHGVDGAQCGFHGLSGADVSKAAEELARRDVLLTGLRNCRVRLRGAPSSLHLKHVHGCEVLCGPVSGSVLVDQCTDCTLALACQQLRTHNTARTRVYLHVTSRAIIEDCRGVTFAPYSWTYPGLEDDFRAAGLDRARNNWSHVDDFNWLCPGAPSPNWSLIPEEERRTDWGP